MNFYLLKLFSCSTNFVQNNDLTSPLFDGWATIPTNWGAVNNYDWRGDGDHNKMIKQLSFKWMEANTKLLYKGNQRFISSSISRKKHVKTLNFATSIEEESS